MDVYGKAPKSEAGEYYRQSIWGWHPLWDLVEAIAPDLAAKVEHAHSNDGDGLGARDSFALSVRLKAAVIDGTAARLVQEREAALAALPDEECPICKGTGLRDWQGRTAGCNGCGSDVHSDKPGKGKVRPFETHYGVEVSDVSEFAEFLAACGGFEIN
jgi:hypothetical protein